MYRVTNLETKKKYSVRQCQFEMILNNFHFFLYTSFIPPRVHVFATNFPILSIYMVRHFSFPFVVALAVIYICSATDTDITPNIVDVVTNDTNITTNNTTDNTTHNTTDNATSTVDVVTQLIELKKLFLADMLTDKEFEQLKQELMKHLPVVVAKKLCHTAHSCSSCRALQCAWCTGKQICIDEYTEDQTNNCESPQQHIGDRPGAHSKTCPSNINTNTKKNGCSSHSDCKACSTDSKNKCAWCLGTKMCKSDNREACAGANDHVGKIQGALGTCDGSTRQASQANANDNTNVCRHKESKSCVDCTKHQHCGWCLSSNTCVDDKRESCKGTDDHVGRLQGATGRCDAADARGARETQIEPESVCDYKETRSCGVCISKTGCAWCLNSGKCQNDNRESCDGAADHVSSSRIGTGTCDSSTNGRSSRTTKRVKADNAQQTICNLDPKAQENCEACLR